MNLHGYTAEAFRVREVLDSRGIFFPLKQRYDWYNHTLEGREYHDRLDPVELIGEKEDQPDPAECPDGLPPEFPSADPDKDATSAMTPPAGYYGIYTDSLGRSYRLDTFGNIIRKSTRPWYISSAEWKAMSHQQHKEAIAEAKRKGVLDPPAGFFPAAPW